MQAAEFAASWPRVGNAPELTLQRAEGSKPCEITLKMPQDTAGFSLLSSARICELYSGGAEPSYICSIKGLTPPPPLLEAADGTQQENQQRQQHQQPPGEQVPQQAAKLCRIEHRWDVSSHCPPPPTVMLRLLSLVQKDALHLHSLQLLPVATEGSPEGPAGSQEVADEQTSSAAVAAAAAQAATAADVSQMDDVRRMLGQLVTAQKGGGGSGSNGEGMPQDPKRALLAAIARSVLQQQPRLHQADSGSVEMVPLVAAPPGGGERAAGTTAMQQEREEQQQEEQQVLAAVQRLDERVARLEAACTEMSSLLRELVGTLSVS